MSATYNHLVLRNTGSSYFFRSIISQDLQSLLGRREFQLSLQCGIFKQAKSLSAHLYNLAQHLYDQIRHNSDQLRITIDEIKEVLRSELEKFNSNNSTTLNARSIESLLSETESNLPTEQSSAGVSLSQLSSKFLKSRQERGFGDKTKGLSGLQPAPSRSIRRHSH